MLKVYKTDIKINICPGLAWSTKPWLILTVSTHVGKYPTWQYKRLWSKAFATTGQLKLTETQTSYAMTGLVSATISGVTIAWVKQPVDIVGAAVIYFNDVCDCTTASEMVNADFSPDYTLSQSRMISIQPGGQVCITSVQRWTCGHHFCSCGSLEAVPAILEIVVTFGVNCYVVIFSCSICQILVVLTYVN